MSISVRSISELHYLQMHSPQLVLGDQKITEELELQN